MLEDFYNLHHEEEPERQISLDVEVDSSQLRSMIRELKNQSQELNELKMIKQSQTVNFDRMIHSQLHERLLPFKGLILRDIMRRKMSKLFNNWRGSTTQMSIVDYRTQQTQQTML